MFGSQVLDVGIGLIFVFLLLSLVISALNELVAAWLRLRAKTLRNGVVRMVGNESFAGLIYSHPLIESLSRSSGKGPSYIPARTFALAVMDVLTGVGAPPPKTAKEITDALAKLPEPMQHLATTLTVLLHDAAGNVEEFRNGLEQWFSNSMERVSGWYKRRTQWILLAMAGAMTIATNADAIMLGNVLWRDPALRSALVVQAQQYAAANRQETEAASTAQQQEGPPPPPAETPAEAPDIEAASANLDRSLADIRSLGLPLGWRDPAQTDDPREPLPTLAAIGPTLYRHGLGWLLTTIAISLGAPFWFDMLNKVISIRAAGKAPEEKQKAPKEVPKPVEPGKETG